MGTDPRQPRDCECSGSPGKSSDTVADLHFEDGHASRPISILLIDDDRDDYILTKDLVADFPAGRFKLEWVSSYDAGLAEICRGAHDVYLLDYRLGVKTGIDLLREAQAKGCSAPVILLTGQGHSQTDLEALAAGADDYLEKLGLTAPLLERSIRYAMAQSAAEAELERKVKQRTDELAKANAALREADRRKDEFLSTLGHELRNPLAPIRNALEIMRLAGERTDVIVRQRERLERQVSQMVRLVDDLLDVSRVVTGKLRLSPETLTIQEVLETALDLSRPNFEKISLPLVLEVPTDPIWLYGDRVRLAQVFSNVLNNAAKYTEPSGRVDLKVIPGGERVTVTIRDTGVGIAPLTLPYIFDLFTQVDRTTNRSQGGLGVGLALVKRLVEMHRGRVSAKSDGPGTGAEFTVELPVVAAPTRS